MKTDDGFHDLGEKPPDCETKTLAAPSEGRVYYPSLYFHGKQAEGIKDLPNEGEAVIKFKKVSQSERTEKRDGKEEKTYSVELEIHAIKAGKETKSEASSASSEQPTAHESDEDAIEKGLEAASKASKK